VTTSAAREELLVTLASLMLALPDDAPRTGCLTGVGCSGKTTLAAELVDVVRGAGRPVLPVAYDLVRGGRWYVGVPLLVLALMVLVLLFVRSTDEALQE